MTKQNHAIKQQILELYVSSDANAFELQNEISALYRNHIVPLIDTICSQLSDPETIYRINRLEIDLGDIEAASLETDFVQRFAEALSTQLSQILTVTTAQPAESISIVGSLAETQPPSLSSPAQARFELFREFLQTGQLPWWHQSFNKSDLEECFNQLLIDSSNKLRVLLQRSLKQEKILHRILYQFSEAMRMETLKLLAPALYPTFRIYLEDLQRLILHIESLKSFGSQRFSQIVWQGLFLYLSLQHTAAYPSTTLEIDATLRANLLHIAIRLNLDGRSFIQQLRSTIDTLISTGNSLSSNLLQILSTFSTSRDLDTPLGNESDQGILETSPSKIEDVYIQNAGMILLWPFLNRFFEVLSLVESGQFISLQSAHRAALFLQYLVDGALESLEPSLPLNKILCGLDVSDSLPTDLVMTENEQQECETVLQATIQNWSALGTLSIAGLRQAFLHRAGVLRSHREGWLLQVEQQTYDVLLDRLPWGIRVIKLPWMAQVLHTEW